MRKNGRAKAVRFSTLAAIREALDCQPGDILTVESPSSGAWSDPVGVTLFRAEQSDRLHVSNPVLTGEPAPIKRRESHMKSILAAGSIAALAALGLAAPASAAPAEAACFGQVHKTVNGGGLPGFDNVGELVQALGGQGKNAAARGLC